MPSKLELPEPKTPADIPHVPPKGKDQSDKHKEYSEMPPKGKDRSDALSAESVGFGALGLQRDLVANPPAEGTEPFLVGPEARVFHATFRVATPHTEPGDDVVRAHYEYLHNLTERGKLDSAGVFGTGERYLQLLVTESRQEAEELIAQDPFVEHGVYDLDELHEVFPA